MLIDFRNLGPLLFQEIAFWKSAFFTLFLPAHMLPWCCPKDHFLHQEILTAPYPAVHEQNSKVDVLYSFDSGVMRLLDLSPTFVWLSRSRYTYSQGDLSKAHPVHVMAVSCVFLITLKIFTALCKKVGQKYTMQPICNITPIYCPEPPFISPAKINTWL